jgi:hypothetical protein
MKLKKAIIQIMDRDQLKQVCDELELTDVDRRSRKDMDRKVSRTHRAVPELLFGCLMEPEVKIVCELVGESPIGRRNTLTERLLNLDPKSPPGTDKARTTKVGSSATPPKEPPLKSGAQTAVVAETTEPIDLEKIPNERAIADTSSSIPQSTPTIQSVLGVLARERLYDLDRVFGAGLRSAREKNGAFAEAAAVFLGPERLLEVLRELGRDELRPVPASNSSRRVPILGKDLSSWMSGIEDGSL